MAASWSELFPPAPAWTEKDMTSQAGRVFLSKFLKYCLFILKFCEFLDLKYAIYKSFSSLLFQIILIQGVGVESQAAVQESDMKSQKHSTT
jgi:hypothetical protein